MIALSLLKAVRPRQWTKNLIIYGALVFDQKLLDLPSVVSTTIGFFLLCLAAGTVYIINDIVDVEKDRQHPVKRQRPIASGQISILGAISFAAILLLVTLPISFWLNPNFGWLIVLYLVLHVAYSFKLKHMVIIDAMSIAAGFTIRVGAGVALIEVARFSPWLFACSTLLMLFMAFGKRRQEIVLMKDMAETTRTILGDYSIELLDHIIIIIASSTIMAYALYTFNAPHLPDNHAMMLTIPFVVYGVFRYLYLIHIQGLGGDPSEVLLQDRSLQLTLLLWGICAITIVYWENLSLTIFSL
ncbi:MAG: decaprenyl-phosphate phosphoribosyltransferase [Chloroflexota bacterium]